MDEEMRLRFAAKMIIRSHYGDGAEEEAEELPSRFPTLDCSTENCEEPSDYGAVEDNQHSFESIKLDEQGDEHEIQTVNGSDDHWTGLGDEHYTGLCDDEWRGLGDEKWLKPTGPYWTPELDTYERQESRGGEGVRMRGKERGGGEDVVKYRQEWYRGERVNHLPRWQTIGVPKRRFATTTPARPSLRQSRGETSIPFHTLLSPAIKNHSSEKMGGDEETEVREAGPTDKVVDETKGREAEDGRADYGERVEGRDSEDGDRVKGREADDGERVKGRDTDEDERVKGREADEDERVKGREADEGRKNDNVGAQAETLVKVVMVEGAKPGLTSPSRQPNNKDKRDRVCVGPSLGLAPIRSVVSLYNEVGTRNLSGFFNPRKISF